ncbi:MAG: glycoside hydrolase family 3 N-terminal domain-containing protein [Caldilineaceae bacterium]
MHGSSFAQTTTSTPLATLSPAPTESGIATPTPEDIFFNTQVDTLLANMRPAERVGQLFMITFDGNNTDLNSDIAQLIYAYHVGGVVLSPENGNFSNAKNEDTPRQVATLVNQLQAIAYGYLLPENQALTSPLAPTWPPTGTVLLPEKTKVLPLNIPLFIAVEQAGDDLAATALRRNFTTLPTQMALGATWNPELTYKVGQIVGRELKAVGVNMLLGPNLDVVDQPRTGSVGGLGVQSFGGDPYWVSVMGRAYISGVHDGSAGRLATIVRHFPGQGDIDRLPDQEVATVQKSLQELKQVALQPFIDVTRQQSTILRSDGDPSATDGMMSGHTRYSALQGSSPGRAVPISLAPELNTMLNQGDFKNWRAGGGIIMSDALGVPALQRYYDASLKIFPHRRVALDAFTAGNDLLYLSEPNPDLDWPTRKQHIVETIAFFQERYTKDSDFRAHVDDAVRRILRLKLGLYAAPRPATVGATGVPTETLKTNGATPLVPLAKVLAPEASLDTFNPEARQEAGKTIEKVARESLTFLYPDLQQITVALPAAPGASDHLLIFSDSRLVRECARCTTDTALGPDEIAQIINALYGTSATGQLRTDQVVSRTFTELAELLKATNKNSPTAPQTTAAVTTTVPPSPTQGSNDRSVEIIDPQTNTPDKNAITEQLISESNWLIFVMLDVAPEQQRNSDVVKQFLHQRSEELGDKHVVVFALNAPYFLDATEISKLTAYFGVYSKTQPFLESAVRALFRSYSPPGAPPVDVPGTRFSTLAERLKPDPSAPLALHIFRGDQELALSTSTDAQSMLTISDTIRIRVGPVSDFNGHLVHDNTLVNLQLKYQGAELTLPLDPIPTINGYATRDITLDKSGVLLVSASSEGAATGKPIVLNIQPPNSANVVVSKTAPSAVVTLTKNAVTQTTQPTQSTATTGSSKSGNASQSGEAEAQQPRVNLITLFITLVTIMITLSLLLIVQIWVLPRHTLVRSMLWATIFGLSAYILYGLGLIPGANQLRDTLHNLGPVFIVFIAMLLPLLWLQLRSEQAD